MTDRVNRVLLLLVGLALVAASLWGLSTAFDVLPPWLPPMEPPASWYGSVVQAIADDPLLWGSVVAAAIVVLVVAALWWALAQIRPSPRPRLSTTTLTEGDVGRTNVEPAALAKAVARDLENRPGIVRADARLGSLGSVVRVELDAVLAEDMDRRGADFAVSRALDRLGQAVDRDDIRADIRLRYSDRAGTRVR